MINGVHLLVYANDAAKARAFFRDVLGYSHVSAGEDWLIFALPPAEIGFHPTEGEPEHHVMYFMCADLDAAMAELAKKGVVCGQVHDQPWGRLTSFEVPGASTFGMYQPRHPVAYKTAGSGGKGRGKAKAKAKPKAKAKARVKPAAKGRGKAKRR